MNEIVIQGTFFSKFISLPKIIFIYIWLYVYLYMLSYWCFKKKIYIYVYIKQSLCCTSEANTTLYLVDVKVIEVLHC